MGWFDWIRHTAGKVSEAIKIKSREPIGLPEELALPEEVYPATVEELEELMEQQVQATRFISEGVYEQADRLAKGARAYEPLKTRARVRQWVQQTPEQVVPGPGQQVSVRKVYIGPDGEMFSLDIAFPTGERYTESEYLKRAASALDDEIAQRYGVETPSQRYGFLREYVVAEEVYLQSFPKL